MLLCPPLSSPRRNKHGSSAEKLNKRSRQIVQKDSTRALQTDKLEAKARPAPTYHQDFPICGQ